MRRILMFAALLSVLLPAAPARAVPAPPARAVPAASGDFHDLVGQAKVVFAGTVSGSVCARLREGMITETTFRHLIYLKGTGPADSLTIRRRGGNLEGAMAGSEDQPDFCIGERCVLFASGGLGAPSDSGSRFVGTLTAVFRIFPESPKEKPAVHSANGTPVAAIKDGRILYAAEENDEKGKIRMSEKEFLEVIRSAAPEGTEPTPKR